MFIRPLMFILFNCALVRERATEDYRGRYSPDQRPPWNHSPPQARRWTAPPGPAKRFLSHLLTYPLTLAAGLTEAGVAPWADTSAAAEVGRRVNAEPSLRPTLSVVCIGARAEGSLPPSLWLEAIFALPGVSHLDLSLVGPEVTIPRNLPVDGTSREASMPQPTVLEESRHEGKSPSLKLCLGYRTAEITWIRAVVGEQAGQMTARSTDLSKEETLKKSERAWGKTEEVERILRKADAYVLFNPGLGHPHLVQSWEVATEMLLKSGKPVVITGHSEQDLNRDARQLSLIGGQCCVRWDKGRGNELRTLRNAFGSMRRTQDPLAVKGADLVSPNWGMLVLRATQGNVNEW